MKSLLISVTALLSLLISMNLLAGSGVYKWKDERGSVHYTQYKPTDYESEEVDAPPPPPSVTYDLNEKFAKEIEGSAAGSDRQKTISQSENKDKTNQTLRAQRCETAKSNLKTLENSAKVSFINAAGEKVRMGEDERAAKIEESKKQVGFYCE